MGILPKRKVCPVCGRPIRGDVRIKIKDNVELCKTCSAEIEMDSALLANQTVEDIKQHLVYRKENQEKMERFRATSSAEAGSYFLRADSEMELWYCTNDRADRNPPLFDYDELMSAVYLEDGKPAGELKTGLKSLFGEKTAPTLIQSMKIVIEVNNPYFHELVVETLQPGRGMTTGTMQYKMNRRSIQSMMDCLYNIQNHSAFTEHQPISDAEETSFEQTEPESDAGSEPEDD